LGQRPVALRHRGEQLIGVNDIRREGVVCFDTDEGLKGRSPRLGYTARHRLKITVPPMSVALSGSRVLPYCVL